MPTSVSGAGGLEAFGLTVRFGATEALKEVSLEVPAGTVTAVLGPSGCGKSTLLRAIAGLEAPVAGGVGFGGQDLTGLPPHRRGCALMFQDGQLFAHLDVARNVAYPLRLRGLRGAALAAEVDDLLRLVGLPGYGRRRPGTLSGGERQRVALARALAARPRVLLLDEPLSALDRGLREHLAGELREILHRAGTTAVVVTHDHDEAFAIADRLVLLREGRVVQAGTLAEVWARPADAWAARFLGYAEVVSGSAAAALREVVDPSASWTQLALRRSAVRVDPDGPLSARVVAARTTPEQLRLELEVVGLGRLPGVAETGTKVAVGDVVGVRVDLGRTAPVPGPEAS